uniref:Uncharacterized protein n=1 Tax=Pseudomonas phage MK TaxID=3015287 RepID=A0AAT9TS48_9VIRU
MTASYSTEKRGQRWAIIRTEPGYRGDRVTVLGFCINQTHALKTVAKFRAWQALGWPYTLKDDRNNA